MIRRRDRGQPEPDRQDVAQDLLQQLIGFKRTLHLIRTGSGLHHRTTAAGVPVLGVLRRCGPLRTTAIAAEVGLDPSTVSRQVDGLVRSRHVEKVPDPADRRAALVQLTALGRDELTAHIDTVTATLDGVLDQWTVEEIGTLAALLDRLNADVHARFAATPSPSPSPAHAPQENP